MGARTIDEVPTYVSHCLDKYIVVCPLDKQMFQLLRQMGFKYHGIFPRNFSIKAETEAEKARIFAALRDLGICFSLGKEWSPSEMFEDYRDRGLLEGPYRRIGWASPKVIRIDTI